jgi:hypothetical protein
MQHAASVYAVQIMRLIVLLFVLCFVTSACVVDGGYGHEHHHYGWWH